ncbi:hypothetical protein [Bifidobacterium mongoliense]|uniref:hypothetical protein n=1 Tax=Bifidobacterium mongoliense TaxID=518643 RepID=UPI0030ED36BA
MSIDILPAGAWAVAVLLSAAVIVICLVRSRTSGRRTAVYAVSWPVIVLHLISLVSAMAPYLIVAKLHRMIGAPFLEFYMRMGWWSAAVVIVLAVTQLVVMYRQAQLAMRAQLDAVGRHTAADDHVDDGGGGDAGDGDAGDDTDDSDTHHAGDARDARDQ